MEVKGKIIQKFDLQSGTSKAGNPWKKQNYLLETLEGIPRKIYFDFFGDRADQFNFNVGDVINLYFDIESREYQGRYYTDIRGWKADTTPTFAAGRPRRLLTHPPAQHQQLPLLPLLQHPLPSPWHPLPVSTT